MIINLMNWEVRADSVAHKRELFDYATSKGVPCLEGPPLWEKNGGQAYRDDADLYIGWLDNTGTGFPSGLVSSAHEPGTDWVSAPMFKLMCDEYAAALAAV